MSIRVSMVGGMDRAQSVWSMCRGFERAGCDLSYYGLEHIVGHSKVYKKDTKDLVLQACEGADLLVWWQPKNWPDPQFISDIREKFPKLKTASWSVDDPHVVDTYDPEPMQVFEYGITCCKGSMPWYEGHGVKPVFATTPCDRDLHGKAVPNEDERCDISFVSSNTYRRDRWPKVFASRVQMIVIVSDLGKIHLYGGWNDLAGSWGNPNYGLPEDYHKCSRGHKAQEEMPGIFAASRINLGSTVRPDGYLYINRRVIECMGSGGLMLSDRINGIEELLEDGKNVVLWDTLEELRSKTKWYLAHEDKRKEVALAGQKKAFELWDNEKVVVDILKDVGLA